MLLLDGRQVGGIAGCTGYNDTNGNTAVANISQTKNTGRIEGIAQVGGITGILRLTSGTIEESGNTGVIYSSGSNESRAATGGIVGIASGTIQYCYNTGKVESNYRGVGGINGYSGTGTVAYCYNAGEIYNYSTAYPGRTGGIIGWLSNTNLTITSCWQLTGCVKQGEDNNSKNGTNKTEAQIKALTWSKYTLVDNGFPVLTWETN